MNFLKLLNAKWIDRTAQPHRFVETVFFGRILNHYICQNIIFHLPSSIYFIPTWSRSPAEVSEMEAWQLEPGLITARWRVSFVAPLPPTLKLLELPEDVPKIPGAAVRVETTMR